MGTFIRIKPLENVNKDGQTYEIPSDNPYLNSKSFRPEVWSYGHRNPWRWSFDSQAPYSLWLAEVGQSGFEEVNLVTRAGNYGWPVCEGFENRAELGGEPSANCREDFVPPVDGYSHSEGRSVIGGIVYRGTKLSKLSGSFIFGDYVSKKVWNIASGGNKQLISPSFPENIASFGTDLSGNEIFVSTYGIEFGDGKSTIYRVVEGEAQESNIPRLLSETGIFADMKDQVPSQGVIPYTTQVSAWADGLETRKFIAIPNGEKVGFSNSNWDFPRGTVLIKHRNAPTRDGGIPLYTAVLVKQTDSWYAVNYEWNADGSDARLVETSKDVNLRYVFDGATQLLTQTIQSGVDCVSCHTGKGSANPLAMKSGQLNEVFQELGLSENQITTFTELELFNNPPQSLEGIPQFASPLDETQNLTTRIKSYLDTNCAQCHQSSFMDLRFETPLDQMNIVDFESGGRKRIDPFDPSNSLIFVYQTTDNSRMPRGTRYTNAAAEEIFQRWIEGEGSRRTKIEINSPSEVYLVNDIVDLEVREFFDTGLSQTLKEAVIWGSDNRSIIDFGDKNSPTVKVRGKKTGTVTITATVNDLVASLKLTFTAAPLKPTLNNVEAISPRRVLLNWTG